MRKIAFLIASILVLAIPNWFIFQKEMTLAKGQTVLLKLAPVDPRSLIQGDYMRLSYDIERRLRSRNGQSLKLGRKGHLVISIDKNKVAQLTRMIQGDKALAKGEHLLLYRYRSGQYQIGSPSFFFQEGHAKLYESAAYGEVKLTPSGDTILVGLRDRKFKVLKPL